MRWTGLPATSFAALGAAWFGEPAAIGPSALDDPYVRMVKFPPAAKITYRRRSLSSCLHEEKPGHSGTRSAALETPPMIDAL